MIYFVLRNLVRLTLQFYHRNVEVIGKKNIPVGKPVILVGNHPSAFMEPIVLSSWVNRSFHFMIRGDMWKKKGMTTLLDGIHGVPVYRKSEGYTAADANKKTFDRCVELIIDRQLLLIFAEGSHKLVRRLRGLKKGTARIALQAMTENPEEEIYMVPVGAIFNAPLLLRRDVHLSIGKAIPLRQYISEVSPAATLNNITKVIADKLSAELPNITEEEELIFEKLIYEEAEFGKPFSQQWKDAQVKLKSISPEEKQELITNLKSVDPNLQNSVLSKQLNIGHWIVLVLLAIPAWVGKILHFIPITQSERVTRKIVKKMEFYSSLRTATLLVFMIVWYLLLSIISLVAFGNLWPILGMVILGMISVRYFDLWRIARAR